MAERSELGASGTYRAPFSRALDRRGSWRDNLLRWGGIALIAGGVLGLLASALLVAAVLRAPDGAFSYAYDRFSVVASLLQRSPKSALICAGLAGLYFSLDSAPESIRRMALTGVVLATLVFIYPLTLLLGQALGSQDAYGASSGPLFSRTFYFAFSLVAPSAGIALCGVAVFWARGLGRGRFMLLAMGMLDSPLLYWLVFVIVRNSIGPPLVPYADTRVMEFSLQVPVVVTSVGWILVGRLLYGAREREAAIIAWEHRALAEANRSKVRRLYEEAWGSGTLAVVDEWVAEDLLDYEHNRQGKEGFKKCIADLHNTFPDLILSIEEQTAEGDTVTTRCVLSGTDRGGVLWYPPTGKHAIFTGTYKDRFSEGRIVEHRGGVDMSDLLEQLNLLPISENYRP